MKKDLRMLTEVLFAGDKLSRVIYEDTAKVDAVTKSYNDALEIHVNGREALKSTHLSETVISPLAFYGKKEDQSYDFVYVKLTPEYDQNKIHLEKQAAGDTWDTYFDFYTNGKVFDFMNESKSTGYRNLMKLMYANNHDHKLGEITLEHMVKNLNIEANQLSQVMMADQSVLVAHLVPFHSQAFDTNMNGINHLRSTFNGYEKYLNDLVAYIKSSTKEDGLIVTTGYSDSKLMKTLVAEDQGEELVDNQLFSLIKWEDKYLLAFNDLLISRFGLRTDVEIDTVVTYAKAVIQGKDQGIETLRSYGQTLIEQRAEDDYKDRGKRIKGNKLKSIRVKKLREDKPAPVVEEVAATPVVAVDTKED